MNALERFHEGLTPPNWRRETAPGGVAFVHEDRGIRLEAEAVDVEARTPGLHESRWQLASTRDVGVSNTRKSETEVRESMGRAPDRETAIRALYKQMYSINAMIREADGGGEDVTLPDDTFHVAADGDSQRPAGGRERGSRPPTGNGRRDSRRADDPRRTPRTEDR